MFTDVSLHCTPLGPTWLLAVLAGAILVAIAVGSVHMLRCHVARKWFMALACLRTVAWLLFVLILLQPAYSSTRYREPLPELLVLIDTSKSMAQPASQGSRLDEVR